LPLGGGVRRECGRRRCKWCVALCATGAALPLPASLLLPQLCTQLWARLQYIELPHHCLPACRPRLL
jgi:hypothetical protein